MNMEETFVSFLRSGDTKLLLRWYEAVASSDAPYWMAG